MILYLRVYFHLLLIALFVSLVSSESSNQTYNSLAGSTPSTDSGFFEFLFPFYAACKWFYNSILVGKGINTDLNICKCKNIKYAVCRKN